MCDGISDSDGDGLSDSCDNCELPNPDQADCQPNGVGDVCDIADGTSQDCNANAIPDECETMPQNETPGATCDDGQDNDCDGDADCADSDCWGDSVCWICGNTRCDPNEDSCSCSGDCGSPPANEVPGTTCDDGADNDCDGDTDCADPDCALDPACAVCGDASCTPGEDSCSCWEDCGASCGDGCCNGGEDSCNCWQDCGASCGDGCCNDGEDSCNCQPDCGSPPPSEVPGPTCDDGVDNDCDTLTDCDDPDCQVPFGDVVEPFCPPDCPQPDLGDIMCLLDDFADGPPVSGCVGSAHSTDLAPCGGDGVLDLDDMLHVLDAFGQVYQCPDPCP